MNLSQIDPDIDYERILDPELGNIPDEEETLLPQEKQVNHFKEDLNYPQKTMTEIYDETIF